MFILCLYSYILGNVLIEYYMTERENYRMDNDNAITNPFKHKNQNINIFTRL